MTTASQPYRPTASNLHVDATASTLARLQRAVKALTRQLHDADGVQRDAFLAASTDHEDHERRLRSLRDHEAQRRALFRAF